MNIRPCRVSSGPAGQLHNLADGLQHYIESHVPAQQGSTTPAHQVLQKIERTARKGGTQLREQSAEIEQMGQVRSTLL